MTHLTTEMIDAYLDGNVNGLRRWRMARHLAACEACRKRREACEADRAFLAEVKQDVASHEAYVKTLPATLVVAPSLSARTPPGSN